MVHYRLIILIILNTMIFYHTNMYGFALSPDVHIYESSYCDVYTCARIAQLAHSDMLLLPTYTEPY